MNEIERICKACKKLQPIEEFYTCGVDNRSHRHICRTCYDSGKKIGNRAIPSWKANRIIELKKSGLKSIEICKRLGVGKTTVYHTLKANNLTNKNLPKKKKIKQTKPKKIKEKKPVENYTNVLREIMKKRAHES